MSGLAESITAPNGVTYTQPVGLFINNTWVRSSNNQMIKSINPATELEIASVYAASASDVNEAVGAARAAFESDAWRDLVGTSRGKLLSRLADLVERDQKVLATIETTDNGKLYKSALGDIAEVFNVFRYYAGWADKQYGQTIETSRSTAAQTIREPIGVCAQIIPWNYPLGMASWKLGPALACGNTVVIKAAEQTPLSILYLANLIVEAGFPPGVVSIINGYGKEAGSALVRHPGDNVINPMRTMIDSLWQHSAPLQHVIQSMSAACLSKSLPRMKAIASSEHKKAWACLKGCSNQSLAQDDRLMSAWLIGHTYSWLHPQNLSLDIFDRIQSIVYNINLREQNFHTSLGFFQSAMIYSGMLLAFMRGRPAFTAPRSGFASAYQETIEPSHPWLGISCETAQLVTEVGNLIYEQWRRQYLINGFLGDAEVDGFRACLKQARYIEKQLLDYTPGQVLVSVTGNSNTNAMDLQKTDEAYRYTGLLQLYRVFPDLLLERYTPWNNEKFLSVEPPTSRPTRQEQNGWLASLALYILEKIGTIPVESGARCLHSFLFVAVSGELRFDPSSNAEEPSLDTNASGTFSMNPTTRSAIDIAQARQFIRARMSLYSEILPVPKIGHIFHLILKIWSAVDEEAGFVFWLDVVHRENLHTLLG